MQTSLSLHIDRLRRRYGNFTAVSRKLEISPRTFRRGRNGAGIPKSTQQLIIMASKLNSLQMVIRQLVRSGELKPSALKEAWLKAHTP